MREAAAGFQQNRRTYVPTLEFSLLRDLKRVSIRAQSVWISGNSKSRVFLMTFVNRKSTGPAIKRSSIEAQ